MQTKYCYALKWTNLLQNRALKLDVCKGSFTQAIWVGDFAQLCNFKIDNSVSNGNRRRQVLMVLMPV
jgi:hypothetical protein